VGDYAADAVWGSCGVYKCISVVTVGNVCRLRVRAHRPPEGGRGVWGESSIKDGRARDKQRLYGAAECHGACAEAQQLARPPEEAAAAAEARRPLQPPADAATPGKCDARGAGLLLS
jgi:hypothetical protein